MFIFIDQRVENVWVIKLGNDLINQASYPPEDIACSFVAGSTQEREGIHLFTGDQKLFQD